MPYRPQWLSEGYEDLVAALDASHHKPLDFDVVIVGSGYGGAVAAARLASVLTITGRPLAVCVLERGREYVPGTFPHRLSELAGHVRFSRYDEPQPKGRLDGLYDFRIGADVSAVVGCGLGGGSLINASVAEPPHEDVWRDPAWPEALRSDLDTVSDCFVRAKSELGATKLGVIERFAKSRALKRFADGIGKEWREAEIAVCAKDGPNKQGVEQKACIGCGDCVTGCNFRAKNTLPMNYLHEARRLGARLFTNVTVARVEKEGRCWRVWFEQTSTRHPPLEPRERAVRARHVILGAGAFGSTEILMRSRVRGLPLSRVLGRRFSGNGDMISVFYGLHGAAVNAAPVETKPFREREVGPTITGIVDCGETRQDRVVIEELAIPAPLRRVFEEIVTTAAVPVRLARFDGKSRAPCGDDPEAVNPARIERSQIFAAMGDDGARGRLAMVQGWESAAADGAIRVEWPLAGRHPLYEKQDTVLQHSEKALGGLYLRNPLWRPLPDPLAGLLAGAKPDGKLLTVHPLGGCPMGDNAKIGVVDHIGRVFDTEDGESVHDGLLVLDGSIIPTALGINPLLTIAALAERAVVLYAADRGWWIGAHEGTEKDRPPPLDDMEPTVPAAAATAVRFAEKMTGKLKLSPLAAEAETILEVEFGAIGEKGSIADFLFRQPHAVPIRKATLKLGTGPAADVSGTVFWMELGRTSAIWRVVRVLTTWACTRALADWFQQRREGRARSMLQYLKEFPSLVRVASNIGEVRHLRYEMKLDADLVHRGKTVLKKQTRIRGLKTFKYTVGANPWRQLSHLAVSVRGWQAGSLVIDPLHLFKRFAAQFQIVRQLDQPTAIADIGSIAAFMARVVLKVHFWSFRLPEYERYDPERERRRLPGVLEGLEMKRHGVRVDAGATGEHLDLPLTRYRREPPADRGPVLLIHGFGASGVQFAHPKQERNLVRHLAEKGFDVWVAELRTSIAVPSSREQWTLDEVAREDIHAIVERICDLTGRQQIDVVAHCIGSAMFCTAVLSGDDQRRAGGASVSERIRRAVLLQVGPLITLSTGNKFRGYVAAAMRRYMLTDHVDSSIDSRADWVDALMDRVLNTYPYPDSERWAHCLWPPWKAHTHLANCNRAAAVFGRLFQHANVDGVMLDALGELLGHTNLRTFEQTVQYAYLERLTDYDACNSYVTEKNVLAHFGFPVRFVHGERNDVFDPRTTERSERLLCGLFGEGHTVDRVLIPGYGHLDPLIGRNAEADVFGHISGFLEAEQLPHCERGAAQRERYPRRPIIGPVLGWVRMLDGRWLARIWCRTDDEHTFADFLIAVVLGADGEPVRKYAFRAPLRVGEDDYLGSIDMLGLIDVPLPEAPGDYRIAIVGAHSSIEANMPPAEQPRLEKTPEAAPLPSDAANITLHTPHLVALDMAALERERLDDAYGRAVKESRGMWKEAVASGMKSRRACDSGYDEKPDSVWLPQALLRRLDPERGTLDFAVASCRYAASRVDREQADALFDRLRGMLEPDPEEGAASGEAKSNAVASADAPVPAPSLLLLAGDQIYADATAGLFDSKNRRERFYDSYREAWTAPNAREVLRRLPTYMMMDDHEIGDDWHPEERDPDGMRQWGHHAYKEYPHALSPGNARELCEKAHKIPDRYSYFYDFEAAGFPFFVCDTRTGRKGRSRIMTGVQFEALKCWLMKKDLDHGDRPKFVVSPSIVVPFLGAARGSDGYGPRSDGWEGFPRSLEKLFSFIAQAKIRNIVFLCGDPHLSMVSEIFFEGDGLGDLRAACIVASPLYAPFPFANRDPREFAPQGRLALEGGATMRYELKAFRNGDPAPADARFVTGDSFTMVGARRDAARWRVSASVYRRQGQAAETSIELQRMSGGANPRSI